MTSAKKPTDYIRQGRENRLLHELEHDPYHSKRKISEPTTCPECGAIYSKGRWTWGEPEEGAHSQLCPACHRIADKVPAAYLTLSGDFLAEHHDEILHLVKNYEQREKTEHPLKRIMDIEEQEDGTHISFTDAHLARGIADAVHHAYQGEVDYEYTKEDVMLRATWSR